MADLLNHTLQIPQASVPSGANFALDIGGSLAKVAFVPREHKRDPRDKDVTLHLMTFDTEELDVCLDYIRQEVIGRTNHIDRHVRATGVSCLKYCKKISDELSVKLNVDCNELDHMAKGVDTLWRLLPPEKLLHLGSDVKGCKFSCPLVDSGLLPCLLVNLGSAMTIVQIHEDGSTSGVIGGSSQGGLTFLGLGALLTSAKSFGELIDLAERGDRRNVDLLVKDTAGAEYNAGSDDMVSSFGKAAKLMARDPNSQFKEEDIAHSLLFSITDQLAQTAYLVAKAHGINRVVICGSYLASNQTIIQQITAKFIRSVKYLHHDVCPVFLRHEGYLGAIGLLFSQTVGQDHKLSPSSR